MDSGTTHPLVGTRWRVNQTGGTFFVGIVDGRYAYVCRSDGSKGRILVDSIREAPGKNGYSLLSRST